MDDKCPYCGQAIPKTDFEGTWKRIHSEEHKLEEDAKKELERTISIRKNELEKEYEGKMVEMQAEVKQKIGADFERRKGIMVGTIRKLSQEAKRAKSEGEKIEKKMRKQYEVEYKKMQSKVKQDLGTEFERRKRTMLETIQRLSQESKRAKVNEKKIEKTLRKQYALEFKEKRRTETANLRQKLASQFEKKSIKTIQKERREAEKLKRNYTSLAYKFQAMERDKVKQYQKGKEEGRFENQREKVQLQTKLQEMQRKLEHQTSEERGSKSEEEIFSLLQTSFPGDIIERVAKGREGCDIVQTVKYNGKPLSSIVYEIKNVQNWAASFIKRAKEYRGMYHTRHILIVTTAFPVNQKHFCIKDGICIVSPLNFIYLAELIRNSIIEIAKLKGSEEEKEFKMKILYEYLREGEFKEKIGDISEKVAFLEDILRKEEDYHNKKWEQEREAQRKIREGATKIGSRVESLLVDKPLVVINELIRKKKQQSQRNESV
ncbi:MAG: DUF2130 domain-containing protein [Candidatus Micrarchaeota archaeon]